MRAWLPSYHPLHMRMRMHTHTHICIRVCALVNVHACHAHASTHAHVHVHAFPWPYHSCTMAASWLQVQRRWASDLDAALPPSTVDALLSRELRRRRRRHRRQVGEFGPRRAPPSPLLRALGGAAYFSACWAWGRWRGDVGRKGCDTITKVRK